MITRYISLMDQYELMTSGNISTIESSNEFVNYLIIVIIVNYLMFILM